MAGDGPSTGLHVAVAVLDIGAGKESVARQMWGGYPGVTITTLDISPDVGADIVADISEGLPEGLAECFDVVLAHHVLEHIALQRVPRALGNMVVALKPGGKLQVYVPSLEWAAEQILDEEKSSPVLLYHLYGSQENEAMFHRSGFTIPLLRPLLEKAGVIVRTARIEPYEIVRRTASDPKGQHDKAGEIHLMGVKRGSTG